MTRDILTVAQLNQAVSHLLEDSFDACWVRGEISNFTNASSGHWYFTLKDDAASVRAVMRAIARRLAAASNSASVGSGSGMISVRENRK
jgi:exonuclease VII large subunit